MGEMALPGRFRDELFEPIATLMFSLQSLDRKAKIPNDPNEP